MPYPAEYQRASDHFAEFLNDTKIESQLNSVHQAYTVAQGVFQVFRRRISPRDSIIFMSALNASLRSLYTADWDPDEPRVPFGSMEIMNREVRLLRPDHNFATDTAIQDVGRALRKHVDAKTLANMLEKLPAKARDFWRE